jgi:hypothetical protein
MGSSTYSRASYDARTSVRALNATKLGISKKDATFTRNYEIETGKAKAEVHPLMNPYGVKIRESRDSAEHPKTIPVLAVIDMTGSMQRVPVLFQENLSELMGMLTNEEGKKDYLRDYYPAIMIGAIDDWYAQREGGFDTGALQIGQFESGIEIDNDLERLWFTGNGGGTYEESYELAMYFAARHTAHDNWEKRGRKGYMFILGDEMAYPSVKRDVVKAVFGDDIGEDIPLKSIVKEVQERYHLFFVVPALTNHYNDPKLYKYWNSLIGQQRILKLDDPKKICELIATSIAITEEYIGYDEVSDKSVREALRPIELE